MMLDIAFLQPGSQSSPIVDWLDRHRSAAPDGHDHGAEVEAVSLLADAPLNWPAFDRWLRGVRTGHADDLLWVKGVLAINGRPRPVVVQGVHHVLHPPTELLGWPDADRRSRLVLILRGARLAEAINASWTANLPALTEGVPA